MLVALALSSQARARQQSLQVELTSASSAKMVPIGNGPRPKRRRPESQISLRVPDKTRPASLSRGTTQRRSSCALSNCFRIEIPATYGGSSGFICGASVEDQSTLFEAGAVQCIAVSPDSQLAATADANSVVVIRQLTSGEAFGRIQLDGAALEHGVWPRPESALCRTANGVVTSWSTTGERLATLMKLGKTLEAASLTKAGELLGAVAEESEDLMIYRCRDGSNVYSGKYLRYKSAYGDQKPMIAMSNDGNSLVSAAQKR